jgi:hypothetical protein
MHSSFISLLQYKRSLGLILHLISSNTVKIAYLCFHPSVILGFTMSFVGLGITGIEVRNRANHLR